MTQSSPALTLSCFRSSVSPLSLSAEKVTMKNLSCSTGLVLGEDEAAIAESEKAPATADSWYHFVCT